VWRIQPVVEVSPSGHYAAWRKARARAWKRDGGGYHTRTWPERLTPGELGAVLLMQSHSGHWRGQPAEIALPVFCHGVPLRGPDLGRPCEGFVLRLMVAWSQLALSDSGHAALLAQPLVDLIARVPKPRIPHDLGIDWQLQPSQPHIRPSRRL
jgi:hypothetical protein